MQIIFIEDLFTLDYPKGNTAQLVFNNTTKTTSASMWRSTFVPSVCMNIMNTDSSCNKRFTFSSSLMMVEFVFVLLALRYHSIGSTIVLIYRGTSSSSSWCSSSFVDDPLLLLLLLLLLSLTLTRSLNTTWHAVYIPQHFIFLHYLLSYPTSAHNSTVANQRVSFYTSYMQ